MICPICKVEISEEPPMIDVVQGKTFYKCPKNSCEFIISDDRAYDPKLWATADALNFWEDEPEGNHDDSCDLCQNEINGTV